MSFKFEKMKRYLIAPETVMMNRGVKVTFLRFDDGAAGEAVMGVFLEKTVRARNLEFRLRSSENRMAVVDVKMEMDGENPRINLFANYQGKFSLFDSIFIVEPHGVDEMTLLVSNDGQDPEIYITKGELTPVD